jgi:hypothetical protein
VGTSALTIVATLALAGDFFHYTGTFDDHVAVRNLYAEVRGALLPQLSLWAGSRMVRGDDVYLLNFWALDNLNLMGGGAAFATRSAELKVHVGLARPADPYYLQSVPAEAPRGFTPVSVDILDRPRAVAAARATWWSGGQLAPRGVKLIGYGEFHYLASGERQTASDTTETLPRGRGFVAGFQAGGYLDHPKAFLNIFLRYARGLAVYDPLSEPDQTGGAPSGDGAAEYQVALSGNVEGGAVALQLGAYLRRLTDPSASVVNGGALTEGMLDARPYFWFGQQAGLAVDLSYQRLSTGALDSLSGEQVAGSVVKAAAIPFFSFYGRGTYTRPHLQVVGALSVRDAGARSLYAARDLRSQQSVERYLGIGAEWWFNSTSY